MEYFWKNNSTPVKVCAILMAGSVAYCFFIDGSSALGWGGFFLFLVLTILFKTIEGQHEKIQTLNPPFPLNPPKEEKDK